MRCLHGNESGKRQPLRTHLSSGIVMRIDSQRTFRLGVSIVLRQRAFRRFYLGQSLSSLGDAFVPVALAFAVIQTSGSTRSLGLVLAAGVVPTVVFVVIGGVAGDRWPRQRVMLAADITRAGVQAATAVLLLSGAAAVWQLVVLQAAWGTAAAFFRPASTGLVPRLVEKDDVQTANALLGLTQSLAAVLGPAASGVLVAAIGPGASFAVDAASFLLSATCLARLSEVAVSVRFQRTSLGAELRIGWDEFRSRSWQWITVLYVSMYYFFVVAPFLVLGPFIAAQRLGGAGAWAVIAMAYGAGSVIGSTVALKLKPRRPLTAACAALVTFTAPPVLLAVSAPLAVVAIATATGGCGISLFNTLYLTVVQQNLPDASLSRVTAYNWLGSVASLPLGFVLSGLLADTFGMQAELMIASVFALVGAAIVSMLPSIRRIGSIVVL